MLGGPEGLQGDAPGWDRALRHRFRLRALASSPSGGLRWLGRQLALSPQPGRPSPPPRFLARAVGVTRISPRLQPVPALREVPRAAGWAPPRLPGSLVPQTADPVQVQLSCCREQFMVFPAGHTFINFSLLR